jgi:hypothetical protein
MYVFILTVRQNGVGLYGLYTKHSVKDYRHFHPTE